MPKCNLCGKETQAFKMNEGGEWNWYCGECYHSFAIEKKLNDILMQRRSYRESTPVSRELKMRRAKKRRGL